MFFFSCRLRQGPAVNFIYVKLANFTYESLFSSYVLDLNELSYEKHARKTLMKLTPSIHNKVVPNNPLDSLVA